MQCDGNLVEYGPNGVIWSSRTNGHGGAYLAMQGDGNLVIYFNGHPLFATGTNVDAGSGSELELQSDGNGVVYAPGHVGRWATQSRAEGAIAWFYSHQGSTAYDSPTHKCELAVENSFGTSSRYASAAADWAQRAHRGPFTSAPRGALAFYQTSGNGHVAISLGNGQVISSSSSSNRGAIGISPISGWFRPGLGWDYSPWGTPW